MLPSPQTPRTAYGPDRSPLTSPPTQAGPGPSDAATAPSRPPRLGIYVGAGASHSWLWLVETCEALGLTDLTLLDENEMASGGLAGLDALCVSGGDAFALAGALGRAGAEALEGFLSRGGIYLGSCAGAYLCLRSSKEPLKHFNFSQARISNLARELPRPLTLPEKFSTPYGCAHVFHPVREALWLEAAPTGPFAGAGRLAAPLYGGPAMISEDPSTVLATYAGFHPRTRFLAPRLLAEQTLLGRAAALRVERGPGRLYLFGPHLEHPGFPAANRLLLRALAWDLPAAPPSPPARRSAVWLEGPAARELTRELRRELSNSRIVAVGLEDHPARWLIGAKVHEPAKLRVFVEAAWRRLPALERAAALPTGAEEAHALAAAWRGVTLGLRRLRGELERGEDALGLAAGVFADLRRACVGLLRLRFGAGGAGDRRTRTPH